MTNFWLVDTDLPEECPRGLAKVKKVSSKDVPIVIDFGSFQCRAGYGNESVPQLVFDQTVHRVADKNGQVSFAFGRNCPPGTSKNSSRSPFDSGLVVHFTSVERILDHIFESLKITGTSVDHPIIFSAPLENPEYIQHELLEMFFEGYGVPKVAFVNDIVPSVYHKDINKSLVISFGHCFTTVAIVKNQTVSKFKRLQFGGCQAAELLFKMIQCKYPNFPVKMSLQQAQCALYKACMVANEYLSVISELESQDGIQKHDFTIQFPYPTVDKALEKERALQAEALKAKRQEMANRLRERAEAKRVAKLKTKEDRLSALKDLFDKVKAPKTGRRNSIQLEDEDTLDEEDLLDEDLADELRVHGFESIDELETALQEAEKDLKAYKNKLEGIVEEKEQPVFDLVDVPDNQLSEEQIKEKRKQRLLKASADAREKMRLEKEAQAKIDAQRALQDEEWRKRDFNSWKAHYYNERQEISDRIKSRQKQREALTDRRSLASSSRLRNVMSLVEDDDSGADQPGPSKKKKTGSSKRDKKATKEPLNEFDQPIQEIDLEEDNFGANDSDWHIYRQIKRDELSDEEDDERDQERLTSIEAKLEEFDQNFYDILAEELSQKATIIDLLRTGGLTSVPEDQIDAAPYQIHMNVERYRVPEVLFQPAIAGIDQAGLMEIIEQLLSSCDDQEMSELVGNIYLTGGMCVLPGLKERIHSELSKILPIGTSINISAQESSLDTWKSMNRMENLDWIDKKQFNKKNK